MINVPIKKTIIKIQTIVTYSSKLYNIIHFLRSKLSLSILIYDYLHYYYIQ